MKKIIAVLIITFSIISLTACSTSSTTGRDEIVLGFNGSKISDSQLEKLKSSGVEVVQKEIPDFAGTAELYKVKSGKYTVSISEDSKNNMLNLEIYSSVEDYVQDKKPISSFHKNKTDEPFEIEVKDNNYIYLSSNAVIKLKKM